MCIRSFRLSRGIFRCFVVALVADDDVVGVAGNVLPDDGTTIISDDWIAEALEPPPPHLKTKKKCLNKITIYKGTCASKHLFDGYAWTNNFLRISPWFSIVRLARFPRNVSLRSFAQVLYHARTQRMGDLVDQPRRQCALRITVGHVADETASVGGRTYHKAGYVRHCPIWEEDYIKEIL